MRNILILFFATTYFLAISCHTSQELKCRTPRKSSQVSAIVEHQLHFSLPWHKEKFLPVIKTTTSYEDSRTRAVLGTLEQRAHFSCLGEYVFVSPRLCGTNKIAILLKDSPHPKCGSLCLLQIKHRPVYILKLASNKPKQSSQETFIYSKINLDIGYADCIEMMKSVLATDCN